MTVQIPWPTNTNPGLKPQEGTGRLINVYVEPRGDGSPVWHRAPGATVFARNPSSGTINMEIEVLGRSGGNLYSTFFELTEGKYSANPQSTGTGQLDFPAGAAVGDLIFVAYAADAVGMPTTPSGFTELATASTFMGNSVMYKVSTGETSVTYHVPNTPSVVSVFGIRGAMSTAPICDGPTQSTGGSGNPAPPNITATTADCLLMNVSWMDDDAASAVVAPTSITIGGVSTFGFGGHLFDVSTGANGTDAATVMIGFRPLATTGAITASTWAVTGGDDEWASVNFTLRHD